MRLARRKDSRLDQGEREGLLQFWNLRDCVFENIYMHTIMFTFAVQEFPSTLGSVLFLDGLTP